MMQKEKSKRSRQTEDLKKEHKPNWKEYTAMPEDIKAFLADRIFLRHNVITKRVECRIPSSYENDGTDWQPITDRIVNSLWSELSKEKKVRIQDVYHVIESDFVPDYHPVRIQDVYHVIESDFVPDYHPFLYFLEHLPKWDGQDYILAMSVSVTVKGEIEEQMLFANYLKKWLVGMVAGWIDPKVVNNVILVLIGEQGSYKTTWFNYLLPPELSKYFYTKTNANRMGRDDLLTLAQYGLVCCEELDTMKPSELNQLKAAVTMPSIDERAAYAHFHEHRKHIASFCGTGNNAQFLSDPTGNRRWLPFEVESIESPRDHPFDYMGIYSQAYTLYQQGYRYWFSREEILKLQEHNKQFEAPRLEQELVQQYFRKPVGKEPGEFISIALALQIVGLGITQKISSVLLGRAFAELGFERKTSRNVRGYIAIRRSAEEMRALRSAMAQETGHTDTDDTEVF